MDTMTWKPYSTDLTDEQWTILEPLIPPAKHGGHPRKVDMREVLNTLFYLNRTGCQWDLLPHDVTVHRGLSQFSRREGRCLVNNRLTAAKMGLSPLRRADNRGQRVLQVGGTGLEPATSTV